MSPWFRSRARRAAAALLAAAALSAPSAPAVAASSEGASSIAPQRAPRIERKRKKPRPRLIEPTIVRRVTPHVLSLSDPLPAAPGAKILVTVRLFAGTGPSRRAAFHLTTNPAIVRYLGPVPTGAGALVVEPSSNPGELVIYRSSTPEGFAPTESLVELEFEAVAPGTTSILLTDVRLFDGGAHELRATYESGTLVIE